MNIRLKIKNSSKTIDYGDFEGIVDVRTDNGCRVDEGVIYDAVFQRYDIHEGCYRLKIIITDKKCKGECNDKNP